MSFLQSSLFGQDFINYRKNNAHYERTKFSSNVRKQGGELIPIVIDSVDNELSTLLGNGKSGKEYTMHKDTTILDFLNQINIDIEKLSNTILNGKKVSLGLEDGTIINKDLTLGYIYKKHRNEKDNILYILVTPETTIYGYIMSILRYLKFI